MSLTIKPLMWFCCHTYHEEKHTISHGYFAVQNERFLIEK